MNTPNILQMGPLTDAFNDRLSSLHATDRIWEQQDRDAFLRETGRRVDIIVTSARYGCSAEVMAALPNLKAIISFGVGYDPIDMDAARARNIRVSNTPDVLNDCVADLALGLMISSARRIAAGDRFVRSGHWGQQPFPLGSRVSGKRLGILGLGRIGKCVAKRASGFDMDIRYHNRREDPAVSYGYESSLVELASWADYLVLTCVGGPSTEGLVSREVLAALGPRGTLINVARGSVVDQPALVELLLDGRLGSAALDVFAEEPQVPAELLDLPQLVLLPHIGSGTHETRRQMEELVFENLAAFISRGELVTPVL
ncbi:2-hydroxyacid dehydrogenase [Marinobacterium sedimentorum]|uniref:2-hydroxyacid dehydrogenase n=1 Tax=Marinobacterium sedimentorum TaxID=2927804 RepID=UPI0020C6084E|nr:2-hydroxyacid dehydrogenase [Marinobacterium sedimentorum]MCP8689460.1 2-hydroxyacid dehydrogenase [Marinobacterium sedimentorum]